MTKSLKGTWKQAVFSLGLPVLIIMVTRWALIETFVIPSSSMVPSLLVHDHIFVSKFTYGLKIPFSDSWLIKFHQPTRGDIIVFKYPENPEVYYVKRLIGLPGDVIEFQNMELKINGEVAPLQPADAPKGPTDSNIFDYFTEMLPGHAHILRYYKVKDPSELQIFKVPEGHYFMMGDNRDQSSDSRYWGFVPEKNIIGKVQMIWLSCEETLPSNAMICDPSKLRMERIFKKVN